LFAIALDYLSVQASAVPCERVFSSSAETDTNKRNSIHPTLMEALQMLKFALKQKRKSKELDFLAGWCIVKTSLEEKDSDPETDTLAQWFGAERGTTAYDDLLDGILADAR
jgi:hypothetical protein